MTILAAPAPPKLPVRETVWECYATVARNWRLAARISWLWLLVLLVVYAAFYWLERAWQLHSAVLAVPWLIIQMTGLASIAVAWHRFVLRQERVTGPAYLRLDHVVRVYLRYFVLLLLPVFVPMAAALLAHPGDVSGTFGDIADAPVEFWRMLGFIACASIAIAAMLFVLPRTLLVLPAVALGERLSVLRAWRLTRSNTLGLMGATIWCAIPASLTLELGTDNWVLHALGEVVTWLAGTGLAIFQVTLISLTYRFFVEAREERAAPAT